MKIIDKIIRLAQWERVERAKLPDGSGRDYPFATKPGMLIRVGAWLANLESTKRAFFKYIYAFIPAISAWLSQFGTAENTEAIVGGLIGLAAFLFDRLAAKLARLAEGTPPQIPALHAHNVFERPDLSLVQRLQDLEPIKLQPRPDQIARNREAVGLPMVSLPNMPTPQELAATEVLLNPPQHAVEYGESYEGEHYTKPCASLSEAIAFRDKQRAGGNYAKLVTHYTL